MNPTHLPITSLDALASTQPMAARFFMEALQNQRLAHGFVLKGQDLEGMYTLALLVAHVLNCKNRPSAVTACGQCPSCHWIMDNTHPAVMTISRLSYLVDDNGKDLSPEQLQKLFQKNSQPTQIKAKQVERLLQQLSLSSEHTRVVIFTDVEELPDSVNANIVPPYDWRSIPGNEEKTLQLRPLQSHLLNAASANRFLKTLEEPPPRTLFFFLTNSEESLLNTIVSRCQVVPFAPPTQATNRLLNDPTVQQSCQGFLQEVATNRDSILLAQRLARLFLEDLDLSLDQSLEALQSTVRKQQLSVVMNSPSAKAYIATQRHIAKAKAMVAAKVQPEATLLHLCQNLQTTWH